VELDEYTLAFRQQLKERREKENEEEAKADKAPNVENNGTKEDETEADVDGTGASGTSRTDAMSDR
jgi:hypothetical protein